MTSRVLHLVAAMLLALPAAAQEPCPRRANVDCAGALRAIDAATAADPWLALLDRARVMRLDELSRLRGGAAAAELAAQDGAWRRSRARDLFFAPGGALDTDDPRRDLRGPLEYWLMRLMRVQPGPPAGVDGRWMRMNGEVVVQAAGGGRYLVSVTTVELQALAWTCEYEGEGRTDRPERLETSDGALVLRLEDGMLTVRMLPRRDGGPVPFCGAAGSVAGRYFRIGGAD